MSMYTTNLYAKCPARREYKEESGSLVGWGRRRRSLSTGVPSQRGLSQRSMSAYRESHEEFRHHHSGLANLGPVSERGTTDTTTTATTRRSVRPSPRAVASPSPLPCDDKENRRPPNNNTEEEKPKTQRRRSTNERMEQYNKTLEEEKNRDVARQLEKRHQRMESRPWLERRPVRDGKRPRMLRNKEGYNIDNPQAGINSNTFQPLQYNNRSAFDVLSSSFKKGADFRSASPRLGDENILKKKQQLEEQRMQRQIEAGAVTVVPYTAVRSLSAPPSRRGDVTIEDDNRSSRKVLDSAANDLNGMGKKAPLNCFVSSEREKWREMGLEEIMTAY